MQKEQIIPHLPEEHFLFTSESVTAGHPDKLCDYISDSVLDACLAQDPYAMVACETAVKNNLCIVFGEISTTANIVYEQVVRQAIKEVGYDDIAKGFDYKNAQILVAIDTQSPEIAQAVHENKKDEDIGAGDQGLMIGYASDETVEGMPLSHELSCQLVAKITEIYQNKTLSWVRPDAKVQVTVEYLDHETQLTPIRVHTVLISCQHTPEVSNEQIAADLKEHVIKAVVPEKYLDDKTIYHLNPSGKFITGGPCGDAGLTGRKIIVDTYGGWGGHGGGAFSGKDSSKVDRSAAYAARWIAKSLVQNGFAKRCLIQLAYGIGVAKPISLHVDTYGTIAKGYTEYGLSQMVLEAFDLRPGMLISQLQLRRPIFKKTAHNGHFGRTDPDFTWEQIKDLSQYKNKE